MAYEGLKSLIKELQIKDAPSVVKLLGKEMEILKKNGDLDHQHVSDLIDQMVADLKMVKQEAMARD